MSPPAARGRATLPAPVRAAGSSRQVRAVKALLVAVFATFVALVSHVLAGGSVPGPPGILVPLALSVLVCLPLSGRVLSLAGLVPSVVVSQLLFHRLFVLGATGSTVLAVEESSAGRTSSHPHTTTMLHAGAEAGAAMAQSGGWMWAGHGIAALVTILLIRRGEAALVALRELAALAARTLFPSLPHPDAVVGGPLRLPGSFPHERTRARLLLPGSISRRGPPRRAVLALS